MEKSIAAANKMIGFQLSGNIATASKSSEELKLDEDQTFEIQIFPGKAPSATITNIRWGEPKSIALELPNEMKESNYEKIYTLLFQSDLKLIVTDHGYEKLGNRKLLVKFGNSSTQSFLKVTILVQGNSNGTEYKINIDPYDINRTMGEIQEQRSKDYKKANIELGEIKDLKDRDIKKILLKLKANNFQVNINGDSIFISLGQSLLQFLSKPPSCKAARSKNTQTADKQDSFFNFVDEINLNQTIEYLSHTDQEANYILREMGKLFVNKQNPSDEYLKEVSKLLDQLYASESFHIFNAMICTLDEDSVNDPEVLEVINKTLDRFHMINLQRKIKKARGDDIHYSNSLLDTLKPEYYVKMLAALTKSLKVTGRQESKLLLVCQQLEATIGLLNVMVLKEIRNEDRKIYKEAYDVVAAFAENTHVLNKYFVIDYLARYGKHAFSIVQDNQSDAGRLVECSLTLFKGLATINDEHSLRKPWQIVTKLFENKDAAKEIFSKIPDKWKFWGREENRWFPNLLAVQKMLLDQSPLIFLSFVESVENDFRNIQKEMDLQNAYFVFGFAELLWKVANFAEFDEVDHKIKIKAAELLKLIYLNNENDDRNLPFNIGKEQFRKVLIDTIEAGFGKNWGSRARSRFFIK